MITKQHSHYLKFLAKGHSTLLLSNQTFEQFKEVAIEFDQSIQRVLTTDELDKLNLTLIHNKVDIIILDCSQNVDLAKSFYEKILKHDNRLVIIGIVKKELGTTLLDFMDKLDCILFNDFTTNELKDKLFVNLSVFYTIKSLALRNTKITAGATESDKNLDDFFDMYEGSSIFIVDELIELNNSLKAGELSKELLDNISMTMFKIADVFANNSETLSVEPIFNDLAKYLKEFDLTSIKPSSLHAFDYLCNIIDDTNDILMELFVDRLFKDVYIFEHSLANNIKFLKKEFLSGEGGDGSELEFF
jgi:hypothetical protein